jgi:glycosyltransferase involved in cell wall biosynthesis
MYWMPFFSPAFTRIAKRLSRLGVPSLAVVHNAIPHERHPADAFLTARFLRACRTLVVLSDAVADDVRSLAPEAQLRLLYHPVYDRFGDAIDRSEARERLGIPADGNVLLFFGNVRRYKGLDVLIDALPEAVRHAPRILAVVAGEFYDDVGEYTRRIRERGVGDHVQIVDRYIPTNEVAAYFSAADVVVHPYRKATQSGVVRTAQAFDVPIIGTDVGGLAADIGTGGVVVRPEDPTALGRAIAAYFNEDKKHELRDNVARIRARSSWQGFAGHVLEEIARIR